MAKPFYSMDEVAVRLGKDADGVRALVREGRLREFRDAGKVFFKAEDVDRLAAAARGKSDTEIRLDVADEMPPSAKDPGASDSITLVPIEEDENKRKKEGTVITASGITVFDEDELEVGDPMAKTRVTGAAVGDEVSIEAGSGSGSGLLDLTREADDTSLGAELLDEIYPGEDEVAAVSKPARAAAPVEEEEPEVAVEETVTTTEVLVPVYDAAYDPTEGVFAGLLVGALIILALGASVVGGVLQGFLPTYGAWLSNQFLYLLLGAVVIVGLSTLIGWLVGKAGTAPRRVAAA